ncbi:hypothetical protein Tco_1384099 [Tanacetum coccineum]
MSGDTVVLEEKESAEKGVSTEVPNSTDKPKVSTDKDDEGTTEIKVSTDRQVEGTAEIKVSTDGQVKGIAKIKDQVSDERVNEAERKFAQLANDEEIARKVQEEWETEEEKKKLAEEEATMAAFTNEYDFIQARLNADKILLQKLQEERRVKNLRLSEYMLPYKKSAEKQMIDILEVLKNLESTKVKLKFEELKENIRKRSGRRLKMKAPKRSKRQKTDSDHEEENHLRTFLKIVPEEEEKIDYEVLGTRYPIINWESKFYDYGHFGRELIYYRVFRADGSSRWIKTFSEMIKFFDRMDLVEIHSLVMKRFETTPPEGIDLLLWGDLRTMFESKEDDELWKNQEEWKLQSWIFYENCGVHVLRLEDGTEINMLAERRYPLTKNTLERMMDLRLTVVSDDDTVFDLLRFIEQQIDEFGGQDGDEEDL